MWRNTRRRASLWNRGRKWRLFTQTFVLDETTRVLDVGFTDEEHSRGQSSQGDNYIENHYPWPENLVALGVVEPKQFSERYPLVKALTYDGITMPFENNAFDIVWSNAVVEHVGDFDAQVAFVKELCRVGKAAFFTTPNRWFPVESHTGVILLHWLPKSWFDRYLHAVGKAEAAGDYMHLSGRSRLRKTLRAAGINEPEAQVLKLRVWGDIICLPVV